MAYRTEHESLRRANEALAYRNEQIYAELQKERAEHKETHRKLTDWRWRESITNFAAGLGLVTALPLVVFLLVECSEVYNAHFAKPRQIKPEMVQPDCTPR